MEAPLLLCYCGGVFHFLEWLRPTPTSVRLQPRTTTAASSREFIHAIAVGLYFVLGFMTKFVAALFLPLTLFMASLPLPEARAKLCRSWKDWAKVSAVVVALCAPWFAYAQWRFGNELWETILAEHVYKRFSSYLDPDHLQPWHFYWSAIWSRLEDSGTQLLVAAGLGALAVQTIRRQWLDGLVVLLWFALPLGLISVGTSKIYHYSYPFLPPLALAGGYLPGLVFMLGSAPVARAAGTAARYAARWPKTIVILARPAVRRALLTVAVAAFLIAIAGVAYGPVRIRVESVDVFKSSGTFRPALVVLLFGVLAGVARTAATAAIALLIIAVLPVEAYHRTWARLKADRSPKRDAVECIRRVSAENGIADRGLYLDLPDRVISHPLYYYFRRVRPWTRSEGSAPERFPRYLWDAAEQRPILTWGPTYQAFRQADRSSSSASASPIPMVTFEDDVLLLLPGPYAACSVDALGSARAN
jgi:4-amino-4-deoxy-L-arabinose transferase-like glycosyltransferase